MNIKTVFLKENFVRNHRDQEKRITTFYNILISGIRKHRLILKILPSELTFFSGLGCVGDFRRPSHPTHRRPSRNAYPRNRNEFPVDAIQLLQ